MSLQQKVEPVEINKLVRRGIRKDCRLYEEAKVRDIIEETW